LSRSTEPSSGRRSNARSHAAGGRPGVQPYSRNRTPRSATVSFRFAWFFIHAAFPRCPILHSSEQRVASARGCVVVVVGSRPRKLNNAASLTVRR
jgi:hypothetical protein